MKWENEVSHLCCLSHPNIVKFYGICYLESCNLPALVMEFAYGGSLNCIFNQRPQLGPLILLDWAMQISNAMHYLHDKVKIYHRDLKSSNILIREPISLNKFSGCTLLITDFGMACHSNHVSHRSKLGTLAYAAPEVCRQVRKI